ncbi:hypothetical protein BKA07_000799 [Brevibacterium marinum]|uniref:Uncharacterized protein n=1 Tax=Brevibacterium marinum TaxID=418643 RepID=A0A846RPC3_9MICO|nr:hypothetical protein [Brevibacterium marinum]
MSAEADQKWTEAPAPFLQVGSWLAADSDIDVEHERLAEI